jgi:hypothetical protein
VNSWRCGRLILTVLLFLMPVVGVLAGSGVESAAAGLAGPQTAHGSAFTLLEEPDGGIWAWGIFRVGQLGDGMTAGDPAPHTITASAGVGGSISPSGAVPVADGADQAFTITADPGYQIADVLVDGSPAGALAAYTFTAVNADHSISASFALAPHTITASAGVGGSISPSGAVPVADGADQAFTITADPGYQIADVLVDGVSVGAVTAHTFKAVSANHTISASFTSATFTITPSAGANGSISPDTTQTVAYGADRAFTITPAIGHYVADVLVDGVSVGAVTTYTFKAVTANHTISASFAPGVQTRLSLGVGEAVVDYGSSTLLTGGLYDTSDPLREVGMGGRPVAVQSASSATGPWVDLETLTTSSVAGSVGTCAVTVMPTSSTYYRLRFAAEVGVGYGGSLSLVVRVGVRPLLGTPQVPESVRAGRSFPVYGSLSPQLPAGQKTVDIKVYRYKNRHWVFQRHATATNADSGDDTTYSVKVKLFTKGNYRFRASIAPTVTWAGDITGYSTRLKVR